MKKKKIKIEEYEEYENYEDLEDDIKLEEYEELDDDIFEEENTTTHKNSYSKINKIINIIFYIVIILMLMVTIDIISVSRYDKGPYFAIKTKEYKDGGTKVYYGLGYKVIKYNQTQGRKDIVLGSWSLKYSVDPIEIDAIDLAIAYQNNAQEAYQKYNKQFLRISGKYQKYNSKENILTLGYKDPDKKYTLNIVCKMAKGTKVNNLDENVNITIIGTTYDFKEKTNKSNNTLYVKNCFAETK